MSKHHNRKSGAASQPDSEAIGDGHADRPERVERTWGGYSFLERLRARGTVLDHISGPTGDSFTDYSSAELEDSARALRRRGGGLAPAR